MRKDSYTNYEIVESLSDQVWKCASLLRGSYVDNNLYLILYLISAYKDKKSPFISDEKTFYEKDIISITNEIVIYNKIEEVFNPLLSGISPVRYDDLIYYIKEIDIVLLSRYFKEIFENILYRIIEFKGKHSNDSIYPAEINKLIIELADLDYNAKIYNPFAGFASFGINLKDDQVYYGQEINPNTWALGQLRIKAHRKKFDHHFILTDSIDNWKVADKFDLVVASPPMRLRLSKFKGFQSALKFKHSNVESFLVEKGLEALNPKGKLITVYPTSFLFAQGKEAKLRKYLIENNHIDSIMMLPSGLLSNTVVPICIIIFKNASNKSGFVKMIDASTFYSKKNPKINKLDYKELLSRINKNSENDVIKYVSVEEIFENNFDLSVSRYFLDFISGSKLSSFAKRIFGTRPLQNELYKQVHIRNLKDDVFDNELLSNELDLTSVKKGSYRIIKESCLLIAVRWNTLKPTYFRYTGEPIVVSPAIVALKIDENIADLTYLINEFSADYVQRQVNAYKVGTVQPWLRTKDLENIVFQLPTMQEQRAKVSGIIEFSKKLKQNEIEKESLIRGLKQEETESSTSLSHILGKPLLSIGSSLEIIKNALNKIDPNWERHSLSESRQFTLSDAFEAISKNVNYIQELADRNTSLVSVSNFDLETLHFLKFLSSFVKDERKSLKNNISLELDIHEDIKEQMDNQVIINGNTQKLRILLLNLIDNAKNHAFIDNEKTHKIVIEILPFTGNKREAAVQNYDIDDKKSYVEVLVANTGQPFPKDLKLEEYVRKNFSVGKTKNQGLGGYEVNEILKAHNEGKKALNIVSNIDDSEFSTIVSFVIPFIK